MFSLKPPANLDPRQMYLQMRSKAFSRKRGDVGIAAEDPPTNAWCAVMEFAVPNGTVTVVAARDGSASIYLSNGGGFIGGKGQPAIRHAAGTMVAMIHPLQGEMSQAKEYPLPVQGKVFFYALTDEAVLFAQREEAELRTTDNTPFRSLYLAGHGVMTAYRQWYESKRKR
jgi:hypothetical protein